MVKMVKRISAVLLSLLLVLTLPAPSAFATETQTEILYLEDGSYIITTTEIYSTFTTTQVTAKKTKTHINFNGVTCWQAALTGTFTYDGTTAKCTASSIDISIYADGWSTYQQTSGRAGNYCYANLIMRRTTATGIVADSVNCDITLTCDANGNLS